jgi:hypothetical protein
MLRGGGRAHADDGVYVFGQDVAGKVFPCPQCGIRSLPDVQRALAAGPKSPPALLSGDGALGRLD